MGPNHSARPAVLIYFAINESTPAGECQSRTGPSARLSFLNSTLAAVFVFSECESPRLACGPNIMLQITSGPVLDNKVISIEEKGRGSARSQTPDFST